MPSTEMKAPNNSGNTQYLKQQFDNKKAVKETEKRRKKAEEEEKKAQERLLKAKTEAEKKAAQQDYERKKANLEALLKEESDAKEKIDNDRAKRQAELNKKTKEDNDKALSGLGEVIKNLTNDLKTELDTTMTSFLEKQESMAYGLTGTATSFEDVTSTFTKTLGSTGVVKQEAVYANLSDLISKGIVFNAEQRAYLATLADDLGMVFDPTEGSLTRLINLQRKDLSDERMAIEYSLKEFLNQNYQTSQYIKEGFEDVSNSLIEAQSLMNANSAMQFEAAVQQWLGSMSSVGASSTAINNLATAIGQLGSGDLSVLSSDQFPLLAMAANNAGLNIGDLLYNGLNSSTTSALLQGVAQYASSIYEGNVGNNIALSQLSKVFGIGNVSDLVALSQVGNVNSTGTLSTNIYSLLNNMDSYLYQTTKINNTLASFMYNWATDVASDESRYTTYKVTDMLTSALSSVVGDFKIPILGFEVGVGDILSGISLIPLIGPLIRTIPGLMSEIKNGSSASSLYDALANGQLAGSEQKLGVTGLFTGLSKLSGLNTSGSMVFFNSDTNDMISGTKLSALESATEWLQGDEAQKTTNDLYDAIEGVNKTLESFKTTTFGTYTKIAESDNSVSIGSDIMLIQDMTALAALNIQNIYALLVEKFSPENVESQQTFDLNNISFNTFD